MVFQRMLLMFSATNDFEAHLTHCRCKTGMLCPKFFMSSKSPPAYFRKRVGSPALLLRCLFQDSCWQLNWTWEVSSLTAKDLCSPRWQAVAFPGSRQNPVVKARRHVSFFCPASAWWGEFVLFSSMLTLASPKVHVGLPPDCFHVNLLICQCQDLPAKVLLAHRNHLPTSWPFIGRGWSIGVHSAASSNKHQEDLLWHIMYIACAADALTLCDLSVGVIVALEFGSPLACTQSSLSTMDWFLCCCPLSSTCVINYGRINL